MPSDFTDMQQESVDRRANNRQKSAEILTRNNINFEPKNHGAHLVVTHKDVTVDFWPGTGKFVFRGRPTYGRGVFNLLRKLRKL